VAAGKVKGWNVMTECRLSNTITKKGIALQATLGGTRFSKDADLN
jgi:hypothetical protein